MNDRTGVLLESAADPDPLEQFRRWYADAEAAGIRAPNAMALATATPSGAPSVRMVLLKGFDDGRFMFFTGEPEGRRAGVEPARRAAVLLGSARSAGSHRRHCRARDLD